MYTPINKSKENSSPSNIRERRAVANSVGQKKSNRKQGFEFVDNRPEAILQRKIVGKTKQVTWKNLRKKPRGLDAMSNWAEADGLIECSGAVPAAAGANHAEQILLGKVNPVGKKKVRTMFSEREFCPDCRRAIEGNEYKWDLQYAYEMGGNTNASIAEGIYSANNEVEWRGVMIDRARIKRWQIGEGIKKPSGKLSHLQWTQKKLDEVRNA
jgi:hypothetical protein